MPKQDPMEALRQDPQAAELLSHPESLRKLLQSQEAQTLAALFQQVGGAQLQGAAQAAAEGDGRALGAILSKVAADPQGAQAMDSLKNRSEK